MSEHDQSTNSQAAGMMVIAQQRMLKDYPFHARFLATWRVEEAAAVVATAGVTIRNGTILLLYNPSVVTSCTFDDLQGVLHHEVNHVLFGHLFDDPRQFPDEEALIVAQEVTVNEWVPEPLPGRPITLDQYPQLPPEEDTHTRYRRLARKTGSGSQKTAGPVPKKAASGQKSQASGRNQGAPAPPFDDHSLWETARQDGELGRLAVRAAARETLQALSPDQQDGLPPSLRQSIEQLCRGDWPGALLEAVARSPHRTGEIDWGRALRRYAQQAAQRQSGFHRPPRRFPDLVGVVPGQTVRPGKARVMAVIDTSGSISAALLKRIGAELERLRQTHEVVVVECDAAIQAVYPLRGLLLTVQGRGGTDLRPPFRSEVLGQVRPDVVVYFTDGCGPAPEQPPRVAVVWCLTAGGTRPALWGQEIRMGSA